MTPQAFAAIDVGTNAARVKIISQAADGSLADIYSERDPVRPGEGVWETGSLPEHVIERLVATMRRFAALCERYQATVRAVATSALREARNQRAVLRRIKEETGINLEVVSGTEEARLICLGVLEGKPEGEPALVIDLGGGSTEVILAKGETPELLHSMGLGGVLMREMFNAGEKVGPNQLTLMRSYAQQTAIKALRRLEGRSPAQVVGSSGTIRALVRHVTGSKEGVATREEISAAVDELAVMSLEERIERFEERRAEIIVSGAVILEAVLKELRAESLRTTNRGLKEGLLVDLIRRTATPRDNVFLAGTALNLGRSFGFDEAHAQQVSRLALSLFDQLEPLHDLSRQMRPLLQMAALLDDLGYAINRQRHHAHSCYMIANMDIPGISEWERFIVSRVVRFNGRSAKKEPQEVEDLSPEERGLVRKMAAMLRLADSLDRSHQQPVSKVVATVSEDEVHVGVHSERALDLELWTADRQNSFWERIFGRSLKIEWIP